MALDSNFFDSINIDVVKKKYYNANKVNALLEDIRTQAEALTAENADMRRQLDVLSGQKENISDAILSARAISQHIIDDAKAQAESIVSDARAKSEQLIQEGMDMQESAVERVRRCYDSMKQQHEQSIAAIEADWQEFLCGLYTGDESAAEVPLCEDVPVQPAEAAFEAESAPEEEIGEDGDEQEEDIIPLPGYQPESGYQPTLEELSERVSAIAKEFFDINGD